MITKEETITLENLGGGAAVELFGIELNKVLDDILDINKDPKEARAITMKVTFKPDEDREMGDISISCACKLAASVSKTKAIFGYGKLGAEAREFDMGQRSLFEPNETENVIPIARKEKLND